MKSFLFVVVGITCIILALVILFMDLRYPQSLAAFFAVDVVQDSEDLQVQRKLNTFNPILASSSDSL